MPFQQTCLNENLCETLTSTQKELWQHNALHYAANIDLYSLVDRAVQIIESSGNV